MGGDNHGCPCIDTNPDCALLGTCSIGGTICVRELTMPPGHWRLAESRAVLGGYALARQGDRERGEAMLAEAGTYLTEKRGAQSLEAKVALRYLADCARKAESSAVPQRLPVVIPAGSVSCGAAYYGGRPEGTRANR